MYDVMPKLNNHRGLGSTFSADQVIGKTLVAKRPIPVKSGSFDNSPVVVTIPAGQSIGNVITWLSPGTNRSVLNWAVNVNGQTRYVAHGEGLFDVRALEVQGSQTTEQIFEEAKAAEEKENDPVTYYAKKIVLPGLLLVGGIYLAAQLGKQFIASKVKQA